MCSILPSGVRWRLSSRPCAARPRPLREREAVWQLHDFLSIQRHAIEGRQTFQLTGLLFVFADFVRDGLASIEELHGLSPDKLAKISAMARMG